MSNSSTLLHSSTASDPIRKALNAIRTNQLPKLEGDTDEFKNQANRLLYEAVNNQHPETFEKVYYWYLKNVLIKHYTDNKGCNILQAAAAWKTMSLHHLQLLFFLLVPTFHLKDCDESKATTTFDPNRITISQNGNTLLHHAAVWLDAPGLACVVNLLGKKTAMQMAKTVNDHGQIPSHLIHHEVLQFEIEAFDEPTEFRLSILEPLLDSSGDVHNYKSQIPLPDSKISTSRGIPIDSGYAQVMKTSVRIMNQTRGIIKNCPNHPTFPKNRKEKEMKARNEMRQKFIKVYKNLSHEVDSPKLKTLLDLSIMVQIITENKMGHCPDYAAVACDIARREKRHCKMAQSIRGDHVWAVLIDDKDSAYEVVMDPWSGVSMPWDVKTMISEFKLYTTYTKKLPESRFLDAVLVNYNPKFHNDFTFIIDTKELNNITQDELLIIFQDLVRICNNIINNFIDKNYLHYFFNFLNDFLTFYTSIIEDLLNSKIDAKPSPQKTMLELKEAISHIDFIETSVPNTLKFQLDTFCSLFAPQKTSQDLKRNESEKSPHFAFSLFDEAAKQQLEKHTAKYLKQTCELYSTTSKTRQNSSSTEYKPSGKSSSASSGFSQFSRHYKSSL